MPLLALTSVCDASRVLSSLTTAVSIRLARRQHRRRTSGVSRDLIDEIDAELVAARRRGAWNDTRVRALEELLETTRRVIQELGRPATLADLLTTAPTAAEQHRRRRLLRALRRS
jgi:hypothetical protein